MNSRKTKIFVVCSDKVSWFKDSVTKSQDENMQSITYIFSESNISWEEVAKTADQCIGAVVIASDDNPKKDDTARCPDENTWLELGWLLARFGSSRVILLKHPAVQLPDRMRGTSYIEYREASAQQKFKEVVSRILNWVEETRTNEGSPALSEVQEVLSVSHAARTHVENWERMRLEATKDLVITGISMGNIQRNLQKVFKDTVVRNKLLKVKFVVLDPRYAESHREMLDKAHRQNAVEDNRSFFICLHNAWSNLKQSEKKRVSLHLLNTFIPAFAAHIADGDEPGGLILLQVLIPKNSFDIDIMDYPRLLLIRRSGDGAFTRVLHSIEVIKKQSKLFDISSIPMLLELNA
jgi:Predicted nucleotide-binding protein containing TIR-like domain